MLTTSLSVYRSAAEPGADGESWMDGGDSQASGRAKQSALAIGWF